MVDIVERLRIMAPYYPDQGKAADEIERLREQLKYSNEFREIMNEERCDALEENERLREALHTIGYGPPHEGEALDLLNQFVDLARDALKEKE